MRAVLEQAARQWKGLPVYLACSENFTVERILPHLHPRRRCSWHVPKGKAWLTPRRRCSSSRP
jgi:hypothetical protein